MNGSRRILQAALAAGLAAFVVNACGESMTTDPGLPQGGVAAVASPTFLECPATSRGARAEALGRAGGRLSVDGHAIALPAAAVAASTEFTMTVPDSRLVEVNIRANGAEGFAFDEPASITISYARCARGSVGSESLTAWKIDPETKAPIKPMGGVDDRSARTVTFTTDSLSSYAIAN